MLDPKRLQELIETRIHHPEAIAAAAAARRRPDGLLGPGGRLLVVAADHPARGALGAGSRTSAMSNRSELLDRLCRCLEHPHVNAVLGTPDILEDLLLLGALEGKVVFASMNRGGLLGARFEIDDRFTAATPASIEDLGYEGGKMLLRIDLDDPATAPTLQACAEAVTGLAERRRVAMVEPFMSSRDADGKLVNELTADAMVKASSIAAGLGATSAYTWLKVPIVDDMERAMAASTLPALILGGEVKDDQAATLDAWGRALALPTVQGLAVGRSLLYPPNDDSAAVVEAIARL